MKRAVAVGAAATLICMATDASAASGGASTGDAPQPSLARPAVDTSMFRDGEVHRRNEMHGRWSLDCDEIPRLAQRYCSLRSLAFDGSGVPVARITISTDDGGRPAALFDLPPATSLAQPVTVTADRGLVLAQPSRALESETRRMVAKELVGGGRRDVVGPMNTSLLSARIAPNLCDKRGCYAVWAMAPADVAALRAGAGLRLRFDVIVQPGGTFPMQATLAGRTVDATVSSDGFGDAIAASVK